ncbi:MAG: leucine-rich repeat protein [Clostridiales bacterium]|nr:leucine-rich repeat protein [Clostridiales bacterium]
MLSKKILAAVSSLLILAGNTVPALAYDSAVLGASAVSISSCAEADYSSVEYTSRYGKVTTIGVSGGDLTFSSQDASSVNINVRNLETGSVVATKNTMESNFSLSLADKMDSSSVYYADIKFTADGISSEYTENYLMLDGDGNVVFIKSPVYDFNVERCSEMWTDDQSLQECLQPQHDIESDDPYVVSVAEELCEGLDTDWEKAFALYTFVTREFAYDNVQLDDEHYIYQDSAAALLRRKIAICEGFGNVFTALCRAAGIPAVVQFGVTETFSTFSNVSVKRNTENANHAWAAVYLGNKWYFVDPTFDNGNRYEGDSHDQGRVAKGKCTYNYYLMSLETFSMDHKICDADTTHGIESSGSCGSNASYTISRDGTLTITGRGEIKLPGGVNGFDKVVFSSDSNITRIGSECFIDCDLITEIILPDTVTEIGDKAFNTCEDLEYIYLPDGLESIGQQAFEVCDELAYVYVPDSVTNISSYAFDDCPRLIISVPETHSGFENNYYVEPYRIIIRN